MALSIDWQAVRAMRTVNESGADDAWIRSAHQERERERERHREKERKKETGRQKEGRPREQESTTRRSDANERRERAGLASIHSRVSGTTSRGTPSQVERRGDVFFGIGITRISSS